MRDAVGTDEMALPGAVTQGDDFELDAQFAALEDHPVEIDSETSGALPVLVVKMFRPALSAEGATLSQPGAQPQVDGLGGQQG